MKLTGWVRALKMGVIITVISLTVGACSTDEAAPAPAPAAPTPTPVVVPTQAPEATPVPEATKAPAAVAPAPAKAAPAPAATVAKPVAKPTSAAPASVGVVPKKGGIGVFSARADPRRGWVISGSVSETVPGLPIMGMGNLVRPCRAAAANICPGLATSWESNTDFTSWTFTIRDGAFWHDGTALTAEDVKFWLDMVVFGTADRAKSRAAGDFGDLVSVEVIGGNKIKMNLGSPAIKYLVFLARAADNVQLPRHLIKPEMDKGNHNVTPVDIGVVAAGPFKLKEMVKGSRIKVRKFDQYWEKDENGTQLPYMDGIDFPIIRDRETVVAAFRAGRIDTGGRGGSMFLLPEQVASITKAMGDKARFISDPNPTDKFSFNTLIEGPFKDVRVRKAVSIGVNRQEAQAVFSPGDPPGTLFLPGSAYANPDYMTWPGYNPATRTEDITEAKRLLADAGYPDGFTTTWLTRAPPDVERAEFMVGQLAKIGIKANLELVDTVAHGDRQCSGEWVIGMFDASNEAYGKAETAGTFIQPVSVEPCGDTRHEDPKMVEYHKKLNSDITFEEQVKIAQEWERYVLQEKVYLVSFAAQVRKYPIRTYVKDVLDPIGAPSNFIDHAWTWLDK